MIRAALFLALAFPASAQFSRFGGNGPDGVCRIENDAWRCYPSHQSVPEASPTLILAAAGAALILRRNGGAK
jgi:hypothetical protein